MNTKQLRHQTTQNIIPSCDKIIAAIDILIPPRCEVITDFKANTNKTGNLIFEPVRYRENSGENDMIRTLVFADTCVKVKEGSVPLRLVNYEMCAITLRAGRVMGEITVVKEVSTLENKTKYIKLYGKNNHRKSIVNITTKTLVTKSYRQI